MDAGTPMHDIRDCGRAVSYTHLATIPRKLLQLMGMIQRQIQKIQLVPYFVRMAQGLTLAGIR